MTSDEHVPTPYGDVQGINSGVRCSCGDDFKIGGQSPLRKLKKMKHCWDAYREHAYPLPR